MSIVRSTAVVVVAVVSLASGCRREEELPPPPPPSTQPAAATRAAAVVAPKAAASPITPATPIPTRSPTPAQSQPARTPPAPDPAHAMLDGSLQTALGAYGWTPLPTELTFVSHSGPTGPLVGLAKPPGPIWFSTEENDGLRQPWPKWDPIVDAAFVRSIELAHAGRTRVIMHGWIVLVDSSKRIWCVSHHAPHLLRCFDGSRWTYRRADGSPASPDEPAALAALVAADPKALQPRYKTGGYFPLNDPGIWFAPAAADAAGNLHFLSAWLAENAGQREPGGAGIHTLRPDGIWTFFRIFPADARLDVLEFNRLRFVPHAKQAGSSGPADLLTLAHLGLPDAVVEAHGLKVEPLAPSADKIRQQQSVSEQTGQRRGPVYFGRFDGARWRLERSAVGWTGYDNVTGSWPQRDGRAYLTNRFGLWVHWPTSAQAQVPRLVGELSGPDEAKRRAATETLVSMGRLSAPALRDAAAKAGTADARDKLTDVAQQAESVARGDEDAVPVVGGRWRFFRTWPQSTMPDGRFAFHSARVIDLQQDPKRREHERTDCLVFYDPATDAFDVRSVKRQSKSSAAAPELNGDGPPGRIKCMIEPDNELWLDYARRFEQDGFTVRATNKLRQPEPVFVDPEGRVFFKDWPSGGKSMLYVYREDEQARAAAIAKEAERAAKRKTGKSRTPARR